RFRTEATAAAALNHPNICNVYDIGETDGTVYIVMEYVDGITLQEKISKGALDPKEMVHLGIQMADALNEARKKHIVHRDIKTGNILLTPGNQVKILDFGLAKQIIPDEDLSEVSTTDHLTETGVIMGTVSYMSP